LCKNKQKEGQRKKENEKIQVMKARHQLLRRKAGNQRPKKGQSYGTEWHRR